MKPKIKTSRFYSEWRGHPIPDVTAFQSTILALRPNKPILYLAGDSSFDNKYWIPSSRSFGKPLAVDVPEIYQAAIDEPFPKPDIAFWLNHFLGNRATALNLAVEASTLKERENTILEHDKFIRDNIRSEDILIVSIGANDIALKPTFATICHMLHLAWLTPRSSIEKGTAWSLNYFIKMFRDQVQAYISRVIEKRKPRAVIVCMIYFPLEAGPQKSWADVQLKLLGYNSFPAQLQTAIRKMFELATTNIHIPEVTVVPCPLFDVLDGKNEKDYTDRVEPSAEGGRKIAVQLTEIIDSLILTEEERE
ncbi:hypothetical protein GLAREA_07727 [Glarea lozoyensis ATCC 20868]|uniref:SGNH hydrolase-type esterase domain-containing protein n=1 Tax=Glarea lozoyensis (strain ATCC 20868 / MF5171) TaxID=1116229 RepID=S3E295_GLAL2|nr:uncharacterized protein GLAREA_07727 [Glarea lozoyensis ATCC 20868]EPE32593.1 hypothetical protein GLAREA_07727 [Glarea lozoyensis ATCC 20868]